MEWISLNKQKPENGEKVIYLMKKRVHLFKTVFIEDVGVYSKGDFITIDPIAILPITHWKYFNNNKSLSIRQER